MTMDVGRRPLVPLQSPPSSRGLSPPSSHTTRSRSRYRFSSPSPLPVWIYFSPLPTAAALLDSPPCWVLGLSCAMDDGGEVRLPRKKGKTKRPPSAAPLPAEREAGGGRGRDQFQSLWQDYHDLLQETEAKKRRLQNINRRKLGLLAEVKFLRKKYSSFVMDDPRQTHHMLKKKKAWQIPSTLGINEGPSTSKNTNLDLNQDSAMNGEVVGCQGYQDHSKPGKHDPAGADADMVNSNVNIPVYRDTGNSPASDDKRAAAWQDRVALKV